MGDLRMYAISINEVRDMFGATPQVAGQLRKIASETFRVEPPERSPGMLGLLGPLWRRSPEAPVVPHDTPLPSDIETVLAGRFVAPERLEVCWRLVDVWLSARCLGEHRMQRTAQQVDQLEFELTRAGLPSQFGIGKLMALDAQLPLRPRPGMKVGYCKHAHVIASARALQAVLPEVLPHSRERAEALWAFLDGFQAWGEAARTSGRPLPDLFVSFDTQG
ncbi:hypothetical protein [Luteococcus sp. OSA5]|uniref:hypothetical protein n=1 Tax=Luteococcus sp. OSA5 TaxID=3401630 RepID=UPI003B43C5D2